MELGDTERFANFNWQPRWKNADQVAMMNGAGTGEFMVVTCMGVVYVRDEDLPHLANHLRRAAEMVQSYVDETKMHHPPRLSVGHPMYWHQFEKCLVCHASPANPCVRNNRSVRTTAHKTRKINLKFRSSD